MSYKKNNEDAKKIILLSAFGIHSGGGLVLLEALVKGLKGTVKAALFDCRFISDISIISSDARIDHIHRSMIARLLALLRLSRTAVPGDILLCFNSLPPLMRSKGRVIVFVHAPHFINAHHGIKYSKLTAIRLKIERLWFKLGIRNCDEIWVQTEVMQDALRSQYPFAVTKVIPLVDDELASRLAMLPIAIKLPKVDDSHHTFFYPADAVGHKNHENLFRAWEILAKKNRRPNLFVTLRSHEMELVRARAKLNSNVEISLVNLGWLSRNEVLQQMGKSSALIFPSKAETFGLPLLEARALKIPIVASECDFVRDVCIPCQTFDPDSPRSIAMAVLRFMDDECSLPNEYYSAKRFIECIVS